MMKKIKSIREGSKSPSNHYWCLTCKKLFILDEPRCPFMTEMCLNTPVPVELFPPETSDSLEKFGLFYPKVYQRIINKLAEDDLISIGRDFGRIYLDFLNEWNFKLLKKQPLQTVKGFVVLLTGCETAQRVNEKSITFLVMDVEKIWDKEKVRKLLLGGIEILKGELNLGHTVELDFVDVFGDKEIGKYFCSKCGMFFEFGLKKDMTSCPFMPQKCMFNPVNIDKIEYSDELLLKQLKIMPDIYMRFIKVIKGKKDIKEALNEVLSDWHISQGLEKFYKVFKEGGNI